MSKKQVFIIGGGAAGFFCAANLSRDLYHITILEQNAEVLQKVKISGGGRCNLTHACFDPRELVQFYPRGSKELLSVFSKFQPADTMAWFSERGLELKVEADNRVFPVTDSSQNVIDLLTKEAKKNSVEIRTKTTVKDIQFKDDKYQISTNNGSFTADILIYTTGSSPKSFKIIQNLRHKIISPVPSLFTFNIKDPLLQELAGTSFTNATVSVPSLGAEESGALLITHWGLSAPAILKLSAWEARRLATLNYQFEIEVNFISIGWEQAVEDFISFKNQNPKRSLQQSKIFDVTNRFWQRILSISQVDASKQMANVSKKEMERILENLCRKRLKVEGKSTFKDEFVTCGGVDLKEINFKDMSSKILPNLFIAGEVLNIDALTGGFNFQACWSEAYLITHSLAQGAPTAWEPLSRGGTR